MATDCPTCAILRAQIRELEAALLTCNKALTQALALAKAGRP